MGRISGSKPLLSTLLFGSNCVCCSLKLRFVSAIEGRRGPPDAAMAASGFLVELLASRSNAKSRQMLQRYKDINCLLIPERFYWSGQYVVTTIRRLCLPS